MSDLRRLLPPPHLSVPRRAWRFATGWADGERAIPEETPIAFVYGGCSYAVMMATPEHLEDFAIGFSLTEGLISRRNEIEDIRLVSTEHGLALNIALVPARMETFWTRRRFLAGPSGCGLCGIESLEEASRQCPRVTAQTRVSPDEIAAAMASLSARQVLNQRTRAVHAAGFWQSNRGLVALREDIGRHNALDKLAGAIAQSEISAADGIVVLTSRLSVELLQKATFIGTPIIAAVSAPTALALRVADKAGITLIGIARDDGFEVFTHPERVMAERQENVA